VTPIEPAVLLTRACAPCSVFGGNGEALLEGRVTLLGDGEFDLAGTVAFGDGSALRFRSLAHGYIRPAPVAGMRVATAMCEIDGGAGELAAASGRITSSFLLSDTGELTDHQLGVIFLPDERGTS
jgi:hypothetical protein